MRTTHRSGKKNHCSTQWFDSYK